MNADSSPDLQNATTRFSWKSARHLKGLPTAINSMEIMAMQRTPFTSWPIWILVGFSLMLIPVASSLFAQSDADFDHGFIAYSKTETTDPIAHLQHRID